MANKNIKKLLTLLLLPELSFKKSNKVQNEKKQSERTNLV